ncbi:hypothetical protein J2T56_003086 [Natronobacillus azotifigens]|uniref:DinB family protein n=1 Tax=Natronobacillus azotifigens TaxID=472978 RepID=A0A9J6RB90_9BACI|nr:DinB family protein [Natronobacillus azotifigens]MCZ0702799.1 DinB family protein [Natronobacillus azotifigens]
MSEYRNLLISFETFIPWLENLNDVEETLFFKPVKEGKWSTAEIIAHIMFWDKYIMQEVIPQMHEGAEVLTEEDFQVINEQAANYVKSSNKNKNQLIDECIVARGELMSFLKNKSEEDFFSRFTLNGETVDQYTGYPHTLFNYIACFVWHDNHHKEQVEKFLAAS